MSWRKFQPKTVLILILYTTKKANFCYFSQKANWQIFMVQLSPRLEINSNSEADQKFSAAQFKLISNQGLIAILNQLQLKNLSVHAWLLHHSIHLKIITKTTFCHTYWSDYLKNCSDHFCEIDKITKMTLLHLN